MTTSYWRLDNQNYYRLAIQLWVYIGEFDTGSFNDFRESGELIQVAESRTNLLIVGGRPPEGREASAINNPTTRKPKPKTATKPDL